MNFYLKQIRFSVRNNDNNNIWEEINQIEFALKVFGYAFNEKGNINELKQY